MTDPAVDETPGLRERKRLATRRAIQVAAVTVVRERGYEATTVDEIARIADVSPRTFFNYFSSKEEAIVGDGPQLPDAAALDAFVTDRTPILPALADLFSQSIRPALDDHELIRLRRSLMKSNPELGGKRWMLVHRFESEVVEVVRRRLAAEDPALAEDPDELARRARLTAFVAIATMRHAWLSWMEDNGEHATLTDRLTDSFAALPDVVATSVRA
jgi:AcrR family transcriptional regulator